VVEASIGARPVDLEVTPNGAVAVVRGNVPLDDTASDYKVSLWSTRTTDPQQAHIVPTPANTVGRGNLAVSATGLPLFSDAVAVTNDRVIAIGSNAAQDRTYVDILAISYATGPRGACHLKGSYYDVDLGNMVAEYMILPGDRLSSDGKGESAAKFQSLKDLFDAFALCKFAPFTPTMLCDMLNGLTGWNFTPDDLLRAGDRSMNIKRAVSLKFGVNRTHDCLPTICLQPMQEGTTANVVPDMDKMLKDYYEYRGWVWETGQPSKEKLLELGLTQVAEDLYP